MAEDKKQYLKNLTDGASDEGELATAFTGVKKDINDELLREHRLKNDDIAQDIRLKRVTLQLLFSFLLVETLLVFAYSFLQATGLFGFKLDEWSFQLLVGATLAQITGMVFVAVRYLFPKKRGD